MRTSTWCMLLTFITVIVEVLILSYSDKLLVVILTVVIGNTLFARFISQHGKCLEKEQP